MVSPPLPTDRPDVSSEPAPDAGAPDFQLEETLEGWTLRISLTDRLLDALAGYADAEPPGPSFALGVRPNLLPGDPFPVSVVITRPPTV